MITLGLSFGYHDSTAALVENGELLFAAAEERFTRQKHDPGFPRFAIEACLRESGKTLADVDEVVFHENPKRKFARVLCATLAPFPNSRLEFTNAMKSWLGRKLWALGEIGRRLDVPPEKTTHFDHHFSHAAQAFMGSGFEESGILVVDAVGDWHSSGLYRGTWSGGKPSIEPIQEIDFPDSLGLAYSAVTAHLGFSPNDDECSTMALAAFGTERFDREMRALLAIGEGRGYRVNRAAFEFLRFYRGPTTNSFAETFGPARTEEQRISSFDCLADLPSPESAEHEARFADLASSMQSAFEEGILSLAGKLKAATGLDNLCLAGGSALNCVANSRLASDSEFKNVFIPPDPGDGGTAVGVALYSNVRASSESSSPASVRFSPYTGSSYDASRDLPMLERIDPRRFFRFVKDGVEPDPNGRWETIPVDSLEARIGFAADALDRGEVLAWHQGRFELGPRALGNRSILFRPDDIRLARRVSLEIKDRAPYRPYALSVLAERAEDVLDLSGLEGTSQRWMQFAVPVREEWKTRLRAGLHVDGTTRPQVVDTAENSGFHALIRRFSERSGLPALVNTSLNESGYPIAATPAEVLILFGRTSIDMAVFEDFVVRKAK